MTRRYLLRFAMTFLLALALPSPSIADSHSRYFAFDDDFGWAIVTDEDNIQMLNGLREMRDLREEFGNEFLYVRDGEEEYVITDRDLIERAKRSARKIADYSGEIGEVAGAQARLSLSQTKHDGQARELRERERKLEKEIAERKRNDRPTRALRQELFNLQVQRQALESVHRSFQLTSEEKKDLSKRVGKASARLKRGMRKINGEIRDTLDEAKSRNLAYPVD